jgi:hypothetical protein
MLKKITQLPFTFLLLFLGMSFPLQAAQASVPYDRTVARLWASNNNPNNACVPDENAAYCGHYSPTYVAQTLYHGGINIDPNINGMNQIVAWMLANPGSWTFVAQADLKVGDFAMFSYDAGSLGPNWASVVYEHGAVAIDDGGTRFATWNSDRWDIALTTAQFPYPYAVFVHCLAEITAGDKVWDDQNFNGFQDAGEPGLEGINISLYNAQNQLVAQSTSDVNGAFSLNIAGGAPAETYTLHVNRDAILQQGFDLTKKNQTVPTANMAIDSDFDPLNGQTDPFMLTVDRGDLDLGLIKLPECHMSRDLVVILDGSGSVSSEDFELMKQFTGNIARSFDIVDDQTAMGVVQFTAKGHSRSEIELGAYDDLESLETRITTISQITNATATDIAQGLTEASGQFQRHPRKDFPDVVVLLTDGYQNESPVTAPKNVANALKGRHVEIFIVQFSAVNTDPAAVQVAPDVASTPLPLYLLPEIGGQEDLITVLNRLITNICGSAPLGIVRNYYTTSTPPLSWTPVTWAMRYRVQVDGDPNFKTTEMQAEFSRNTLRLLPSDWSTPLEEGTYRWRVQAQHADGSWGGWSVPETFIVDVP